MLPTKFRFIGKVVSEEIFQKSTNQKKEWPVVAMFVNGLELNEQSLQRTFQGCFLLSFDSFGQAVSEETIFQKSTNQNQEWPVATMFVNGSGQNDQSLQRTFHRMIDASYQISVHLGKWFQRRRFFKIGQSETRIACGAMFVNGSGKFNNLYRGPSIDASYQISVQHLGKWFQRRRFFQKSTNQKQEWHVAACLLTDRN